MERCVEEVGIGEGHVAGPGGHQLVDVGHHRGHVHRSHAAVINDRHRAVPAAMRAAPAGFYRSDQSLLAVDGQPRVPVEGRQELSGRDA
jgi:hypothetical protein